jgi:RimJ/RimL family protein N-acetyltransferase
MLYGERVRLRGMERSDIPTFVAWFNDPEVREHLLLFAPLSQAQEEKWFEAQLGRTDDHLYVIEAPVSERGGWRAIGNEALFQRDARSRRAELGIALGEKDAWDQGFGTDAVRTLLAFGFGELNLHRIELHVFAEHARAQRCYEKAGFRREGVRREAVFRGGRYRDEVIMGILAHEFAQGESDEV